MNVVINETLWQQMKSSCAVASTQALSFSTADAQLFNPFLHNVVAQQQSFKTQLSLRRRLF